MRHFALLLLTAMLGLSACTDPFQREGTWHATGANEDNLRLMVADRRDLERGVDEPGSSGRTAVAAVTRLRLGQVKPLPDNGISKIGGGGGGAAAAAPPASPAPGAN